MVSTRTEFREKIMTILYQVSLFKKNNIEYSVENIIKENVEIEQNFINDMVYGVLEKIDELDDIANKLLVDWTIDRLDSLGAQILRMGIYEIKYMDTPDLVVINEAINLAKKYSDENVRKMINAVLDKLINE